jgi:hypothetical protein
MQGEQLVSSLKWLRWRNFYVYFLFKSSTSYKCTMQRFTLYKCHRVRKMCSLTRNWTRDPLNNVPRLYPLSYPTAYTSSPLNSELFWTVTQTFKLPDESAEIIFNVSKYAEIGLARTEYSVLLYWQPTDVICQLIQCLF